LRSDHLEISFGICSRLCLKRELEIRMKIKISDLVLDSGARGDVQQQF
jgi:hypothetical protein